MCVGGATGEAVSVQQILQELGRRLDTGDQQMIAGAGAGDVQQVPLCVVDILEIGIVGDRLDALLQRQNLVVARHDRDGPEFETFGKVASCRSRTGRRVSIVPLDLFAQRPVPLAVKAS